LQLRRAVAGCALLVFASANAFADGEGAMRVTLFHEPSNKYDGVTVLHPQADVSGAVSGALRLSAGYSADIVSGASPAVYGPRTGPDAVSGATKFSDTRNAAHGGFDYTSGTAGLSASYEYSTESDYQSHAVTVGARGDLFERNLTLAMEFTQNFDSVCNHDNRTAVGPLDYKPLPSSKGCFTNQAEIVTETLNIETLEPTLTWTASPRLLLQAGGTVQILDGFQSNPYRAVLVGNQGRKPQENEPRDRQRYAGFGRMVYAIPSWRASITLSGRGYRDSWDVRAGTGELDLQKYLGNHVLVRLRGRYHQQSGAVFYRTGDDYRSKGPAGEYWTGDRELSPLHTILTGARIAYLNAAQEGRPVLGLFSEIELSVKFDMLFYGLDSIGAPNDDRDWALIGQMGVALRF
jgi:hypothetical protein